MCILINTGDDVYIWTIGAGRTKSNNKKNSNLPKDEDDAKENRLEFADRV